MQDLGEAGLEQHLLRAVRARPHRVVDGDRPGSLPPNLGDLLKNYDRVLVPEMNTGQLCKVLRAEFLVDAEGLNKVNGKPFMITEIEQAINERMEG